MPSRPGADLTHARLPRPPGSLEIALRPQGVDSGAGIAARELKWDFQAFSQCRRITVESRRNSKYRPFLNRLTSRQYGHNAKGIQVWRT